MERKRALVFEAPGHEMGEVFDRLLHRRAGEDDDLRVRELSEVPNDPLGQGRGLVFGLVPLVEDQKIRLLFEEVVFLLEIRELLKREQLNRWNAPVLAILRELAPRLLEKIGARDKHRLRVRNDEGGKEGD